MALQDQVEASELELRERLLVIRFIEEVMRLPEGLHRQFYQERLARQENKVMEYRTYFERVGERRGHRKGKLEGKLEGKQESLLALLGIRFGEGAERVKIAILALSDRALLDELFVEAFRCLSLDEFEQHLPIATSANTKLVSDSSK